MVRCSSQERTAIESIIYLEMAGLYYIICVADAGAYRGICTRPST